MHVRPLNSSAWPILVVLAIMGLGCEPTGAQEAKNKESTRTVFNASGTSAAYLKPELVRIAIPLYAHTLTAAESLELIRQRKQAALSRVQALSCLPNSVQFGSVTVESNAGDLKLNASSMRMLGAMGNDVDIDDLPVLTTARVDMTADWTIPAGADEEAVLGIVEQLVQDLREQDVTGKEDRPEFSPKVEEAVKQLQMQTRTYISNTSRNDLEEIRYAFVATPTSEEQQEVVRDAFADAKFQIDAMTDVVGVTLNDLIMVSSTISLKNNQSMVTHSYNGRNRIDILQANEDEILAPYYKSLELSARVQVQFAVK